MATYCPQYMPPPVYKFPITFTDWNPILQIPFYTSPVQQSHNVINPPAIPTQICPCGTIITEPIIPVVSQTVISEPLHVADNYYKPLVNYTPEPATVTNHFIDGFSYEINDLGIIDAGDTFTAVTPNSDFVQEPLECYLSLPKELFPTARMLAIDPNPIINEFCIQPDISDHAAWILDLEFGIPRVAITRPIAIYDVQYNSIQCKNTPNAIHPGFESCNEDFKKIMLFYYDCIVSTWYRSYVTMNNDTSVPNFQNWLALPMLFIGMCWR